MKPWGPYLNKSALLKAGYLEVPSSCLVMTPMSFSEFWSREKASLRRGFRGRQEDLSPYYVLEECAEAARRFAEQIRKLARAEILSFRSTRQTASLRRLRLRL